ncbi:VCBS repeat-containing protein [Maribacter polysiphoniae]|uniref:VCBS repeat protein n=1 Tax=Maribacter polysiphoniae TaxID=429344 RepID=A0A316EAX7_9FLAO|nr:VCBS repeat-containing protein [Maribacter polysiphoniae]MBD1260459.1 VCBS repeat-containing protein [Maribacter polysiphoniae]PWK25923.1 VCBS repeat protein [Maribacter polysiphoniae]
MNNSLFKIVVVLLPFVGCTDKEGTLYKTPDKLQTGITFTNVLTETEDLNILDYLYFYNGGGVAIGDINGDELPDIFFTGNQVKNKLYLNKGNLQFEDITLSAGVEGNSTWNTGAIMGDVNGDGLLDIYVCAVVGIKGFNGHNELYINNGNATFTESASKYGLDYDTYSSSAAFLDYDLDGDLDIYLLNHAIHTQESFGNSNIRLKRNFQAGDKLLRNDNGKFTDVSEIAGIYGGINGYGLGVAVADFNQDGFPDIYVGNDFQEDDYYYLNNTDGTFTESLKKYFGHTTRSSMGNDVSDINHDGWPDIISLDMLPDDEKVLKSSENSTGIQVQKMKIERFGYHYQFERNMLFLNQPHSTYTEIALMSGVAATDWSWSALFGDYNQDGEQDIFIANGIPKRPNDLDYINFVSNDQIRSKINNTKLVDPIALDMMPSGAVHNYIFKGNENLHFEDMSANWMVNDTIISGATAIGDLDLDGDIDIVTNNINRPATVYINKTNENANYLKIRFNYKNPNKFGIGTKVFSYHQGKLQYKELYTARGFQASSEPIIHFGYGKANKVDSLRIIWPDKSYQVVKNVSLNKTITIAPENTAPFDYNSLNPKTKPLFNKIEDNLGIDFIHIEDNYIDFNRQKLIPYQLSDRGPATAIGDLNNDNKADLFFGGSKFHSSKIYFQTDSAFVESRIMEIAKDSVKEDISAVIADFNSDHKPDLFIGTGGADFYGQMKPLSDSYYTQKNDGFEPQALPGYFENASTLKPYDYDRDGDLDLFLGNQVITNDFAKTPNSYLLQNNKGSFTIVDNPELQHAGMITDALWDDFDNDGVEDLIVIGEWMSPKFFKNKNGELSQVSVLDKKLNGLWQSIAPFDIDQDGDIDYLLGNWGANSKFKASEKSPMKMYYDDIDDNGSTETIVAIEKNGKYYPIEGLDALAVQMEYLRKKFVTYYSFAGKSIDEIWDSKTLNKATVLEVNELRSGYLENNNGNYSFVPFTDKLQVSPITAMLIFDFDSDGKKEALLAGNYFGVKPFHGRFDSFSGAMVKSKNDIILGDNLGLDLTLKSVRHLNIINLDNRDYLMVTINNDSVQVYGLIK